ncbi:DUF396-domain-containing protein [Epithele typhae]|uniref:DUF396-domain-containing protein n=1 Tax=Epithele typhae TaxID=378194 RepID=UPI0020081CC0|nr:DUF396-domain-containing protein [Epithele typhae]KAH9943296.1 DUF396-domain-containing protein [Epithele typhae]
MTLLHLLSYAGAASAFVFITLSLASGLLWISEVIEEHSRLAKVVGQRSIYAIILVHFLLYFYDALPSSISSSPFSAMSFLGSCVLVVADHFLWFFYFARLTQEARHRANRHYRGSPLPHAVPNFGDIATFFGVCVWLAPLFLFLSLSANDNALPIKASGEPSSPTKPVATGNRISLFKALYDTLPLEYIPRLRPRPRRRDTTEGLIAPRSPTASAPPSPNLMPRVSGEIYRPSSPSAFSLSPPPKRSGVLVDDASREASMGGRRVGMRRTASSTNAAAVAGDGWRKFD